jgi:hypothetical protein
LKWGRESKYFGLKIDNCFQCGIIINMKRYKGFEIYAVNTNGLWYTLVFKNNKCVFSDKYSWASRSHALGVGIYYDLDREGALIDFAVIDFN